MDKIEANMAIRDNRIELLASSQKAQAEAAAASAAAQDMFMRQMRLIVNKVPTLQVAFGSGGDDPPRHPRGSLPSVEGHGSGKLTLRVSSLGPIRPASSLTRGHDDGECRPSPDPDPDGGDDDGNDDDDGEDDDYSRAESR